MERRLALLDRQAVLNSLMLWNREFSPDASCGQLREYFQDDPDAPGVLVTREGTEGSAVLKAVISRRRFFERWSAGEAPFDPAAPLASLVTFWKIVQQFEVLDGDLPLAEGVAVLVRRPDAQNGEPLVLRVGSRFALLDAQVLLLAYTRSAASQPPLLRAVKTGLVLRPRRQRLVLPTVDGAPGELHRRVQFLEEQLHHLQQQDPAVATAAHELRTPLTNMRLAVAMLRANLPEARRREYLSILEGECHRSSELINDLLSLQQLEHGQPPLRPEAIHLGRWLPCLVEPFRLRAEQGKIHLTHTLDLPTAMVYCDRQSLERVVAELLQNACKYTPAGGRIAVRVSTGRGLFEVRVANSGAPIAPHELPRLFDRFYRRQGADASQIGSGLGLALVRLLVERLGGTITVESTGVMTTFAVRLPRGEVTLPGGGAGAPTN
jgi:signal transduction histidine kinase